MITETTLSRTTRDRVTVEVRREVTACGGCYYGTTFSVWVDEHDGLSRWGKSFPSEREAGRFRDVLLGTLSRREADRAAGGRARHSLYLDACMAVDGLEVR